MDRHSTGASLRPCEWHPSTMTLKVPEVESPSFNVRHDVCVVSLKSPFRISRDVALWLLFLLLCSLVTSALWFKRLGRPRRGSRGLGTILGKLQENIVTRPWVFRQTCWVDDASFHGKKNFSKITIGTGDGGHYIEGQISGRASLGSTGTYLCGPYSLYGSIRHKRANFSNNFSSTISVAKTILVISEWFIFKFHNNAKLNM